MSILDVLRPTPPLDDEELQRAVVDGRVQYSVRTGLWTVRSMSIFGGLTFLGRLLWQPAFRSRITDPAFIVGTVAILAGLGLLSAAVTYWLVWPALRRMAEQQSQRV